MERGRTTAMRVWSASSCRRSAHRRRTAVDPEDRRAVRRLAAMASTTSRDLEAHGLDHGPGQVGPAGTHG